MMNTRGALRRGNTRAGKPEEPMRRKKTKKKAREEGREPFPVLVLSASGAPAVAGAPLLFLHLSPAEVCRGAPSWLFLPCRVSRGVIDCGFNGRKEQHPTGGIHGSNHPGKLFGSFRKARICQPGDADAGRQPAAYPGVGGSRRRVPPRQLRQGAREGQEYAARSSRLV